MSRERALNQIVSLKALSEDQSTTEAERQSARDAIDRLRAKYDIPVPVAGMSGADFLKKMAQDFQRGERQRQRQEAAKRAAEAEAAAWAWAGPMTAEDLAWARRDPLGFASSRDKRTHDQKQRDMNASWGQRDQWHQAREEKANEPHKKRCLKPETFYDQGGVARKRNQHDIVCDRCGCTLAPREGCIFQVLGQWVGRCCEMVPGPRNRRRR